MPIRQISVATLTALALISTQSVAAEKMEVPYPAGEAVRRITQTMALENVSIAKSDKETGIVQGILRSTLWSGRPEKTDPAS